MSKIRLMKRKITFFLLTITLFGFVACTNSTYFEKEVVFTKKGWNRFRPEEFQFEIKNADKRYNINLEVKLNDSFQHLSLPMYYSIDDNSGAENRTGRFSMRIKDLEEKFLNPADKNGIYTFEQNFQANKKFNAPGTYKYTLEHGTSNYDLEGVVSIRFFVN